MARNKQSANLPALLRKLNQVGSPVDLSVAEERVELEILQVPSVFDQIFELENRRAGYVLYVTIVNQTSSSIYCTGIELRLPWPDSYFDWLPDPQENHRDVHNYLFPGKGAPMFPRDGVLNHFFLSERCILKPRVPYRGWLLAVGGLMPDHLRDRERVEATLVITTSDDTEYRGKILLCAERRVAKSKFAKRETSPYERPAGHKIGSIVGESQRSDPGDTSSVTRIVHSYSR